MPISPHGKVYVYGISVQRATASTGRRLPTFSSAFDGSFYPETAEGIEPAGAFGASTPSSTSRSRLERREEAHEVLVARLWEESGELRARIEDVFEPERVRYELTLELVDSAEAVLRRLVRPAWEEIDLRGATFTLTPGYPAPLDPS